MPSVASPGYLDSPVARNLTLFACFLVALAITLLDWFSRPHASLGTLFLLPLVVSALFLSQWRILFCAVAAAIIRQELEQASWGPGSLLEFSSELLLFASVGAVVGEIMRRKRFETEYDGRLKEASELRYAAEQDARVVIETSPAAILTVKADGSIDLANEAARRLLGFEADASASGNIRDYFPMLADMLRSPSSPPFVRAMMEGQGRRRNGEMFFSHMWLSSYSTPAGNKIAVVVADVSEQIRDREELGLRQLLMNSHIIAGAVSHEIRNLAAAASALHDNIARSFTVAENQDFQALGKLIEGMRKLSSSEIPAQTEESLTGLNLNALFRELDIILKNGAYGGDVQISWEICDDLPRVRANHSGLLQVLLNLTQNSCRALSANRDACITVAAYSLAGSVMIIVSDNGPGIPTPETLFQPFQPGAASTGLGLYVSRAIVRSYGGELRYARRSFESCFYIELPTIAAMETVAIA